MIEGYLVLAGRIRKELEDLKRAIERAQRAMLFATFTHFHSMRKGWADL